MKKYMPLIAMLAGVLFVGSAAHSFGLPKLGGGGGSSGGASMDDLLKQQGTLLSEANAAYNNLGIAQKQFLKALGLKGELAKFETEADQIGSGKLSGADALKKRSTISKKAQKAIDKKISEGATLSKESKKVFQKGIPPYTKGMIKMVGVAKAAPDWLDGAKGAGMAGASKLKDGMTALPKVVKATKAFMSTTKTITKFGKKENIDMSEVKKAASSITL